MNTLHRLLFCFAFLLHTLAMAQVEPLYMGPIPFNRPSAKGEVVSRYPDGRADGYSKVTVPTLELFSPAAGVEDRQTAVILMPGGGNSYVSYDREGIKVGKWLAQHGYTAFALKYRLPDSTLQTEPWWVPLTDAAHAVAKVRGLSRFKRVGVMGFSAGGHLAASVSNLTDKLPAAPAGARPDFAILIYPVISSGPSGHAGTFHNLFKGGPPPEVKSLFSIENQVSGLTPPAFIVHSEDDKVVPVENAHMYYQALTRAKVEAEMHLYPKGGHGYNLGESITGVRRYPELLLEWMNRL